MRRIAIAVLSTISALVLLFSYHTSTNSQPAAAGPGTARSAGTAGGAASTTSAPPDPTTSSTPAAGSTSSAGSPAAAGTAGTYTGDAVATRWGPVQVEITVQDGKITAAAAIQYPQGNHRDEEINAYAVPMLNQETIQAQSADIDAVSGATITSSGYIESLQSAIDKAQL